MIELIDLCKFTSENEYYQIRLTGIFEPPGLTSLVRKRVPSRRSQQLLARTSLPSLAYRLTRAAPARALALHSRLTTDTTSPDTCSWMTYVICGTWGSASRRRVTARPRGAASCATSATIGRIRPTQPSPVGRITLPSPTTSSLIPVDS